MNAQADTKEGDTQELKQGQIIERGLKSGEAQAYRVRLMSGQYIHITVEQIGVNVAVSLLDPSGRQVAGLDWWWREGIEPLWAIAEKPGDYILNIVAPGLPAEMGTYRVKIEKLGDLRQAPSADRDELIAHKIFAEGEMLLAQGTAESQKQAAEKYQEAIKLWRGINDGDAEGHAQNELGVIYYRFGNLKPAAESLTRAVSLFRESRNRRGEVNSLTALSNVYNFSGETQRTLDAYYQALPLARAVKDYRNVSGILAGLGLVLHRVGQTQKALETLNELVSYARANAYQDGEAVAHNNIGLIYVGQGRLREAIEQYSLTLSLTQSSGDRFGQSFALNNIGNAHARMGEFQLALDYLLRGLNLKRLVGDQRGEANSLGSVGHLYLRMGDYTRALQYYDQSLVVSRAVGNRDAEGAALGNLGVIYGRIGDLPKAREYTHQALALRGQLGDRKAQAYNMTNLGSIYNRLGDHQKALDFYDKGLTIQREVGDQYGEATTLSALGTIYIELGDPQKALEYLPRALDLTRSTGDRLGEASALYQLSRIARGRGNMTEARVKIESALEIIESTRAKVSLADVRTAYFASRQDYYDFYIDLLMQLYKSDKDEKYLADAIIVHERRSARSLLDSLAEAQADIRAGVSAELLEHERRLRQDLSAKADEQIRLLSRKNTPDKVAALAGELEALTAEYEQALALIRQASPRYAALTQPVPLSLKQVQNNLLDPDTLLLEYSLGEERSYLWVVSQTSVTGFELPRRAVIDAAARRAYELLVTKSDALYPEALAGLSQTLLGPVAGQLGRKRLVVVAEGSLQHVPFGALPEPVLTGQSSAVHAKRVATEYRPLILNHEVISSPSASVLGVLRQELSTRRVATKKVAVLADPVFDGGDQRVRPNAQRRQDDEQAKAKNDGVNVTRLSDVGRSANDLSLTSFDRLLLSRREAELITALVPKDKSLMALDFAASRAMATSAELARYQIVHFATHSLINNQHPELSGIVLSLVDEQGQPQDGFLRVYEIYNMNLAADLVVLSACQTALGKDVKGEGLVGMTRGFMYAGAPRVVASLWKVSDAATAELMKRFYQNMLNAKMRPAAALRAAQVSLLKERQWAAPYYWAGFVLQGEWR